MDVDDSLKFSFIHLFIHSSFILANDGGGGAGGGDGGKVCCVIHTCFARYSILRNPPVVLLA